MRIKTDTQELLKRVEKKVEQLESARYYYAQDYDYIKALEFHTHLRMINTKLAQALQL